MLYAHIHRFFFGDQPILPKPAFTFPNEDPTQEWIPKFGPDGRLTPEDCVRLRALHIDMLDLLDQLLEVADLAHAEFHLRGRMQAAEMVKVFVVNISAFRFSRLMLHLKAEAHSK